jgi:peptidoglycan/xylan/chitin deacetylase (PgdA/CDA1 family)
MVLNILGKNYQQVYDEIKNEDELWRLFTGIDEYSPKTLDEHGRYTYASSLKHDTFTPSVSEYLHFHGFHFNYPHGKSWALLLTHDVDDIEVQNRHLFVSLVYFPKKGDIKGIYNLVKGRLNRRFSPYNNFKRIIALEQAYDATSTFFFLSSPEDIFGYKYCLEDIKDILDYIVDNDCEVGFHTGYYHYDDGEKIKTEKKGMEQLLGKPLFGVRNHVLRFKIPATWELLAAAGFQYDSTYGYIDTIGFRNGMCHPFVPYNMEINRPIEILEIPLNIQDWTISYLMKNNPRQAWELIKQLIDTTEKNQGVLNILWHNWTFSFPTSIGTIFEKEWTALYQKILAYAYEKNAWITSCKAFYEHYQNHDYIVQS